MDIWIIRDGEKTGPLRDFEVRRRIGDGELAGDTPAWHDGLGDWRSLDKIEIFAREFERIAAAPLEAPELARAPAADDLPPPLPARRCFARRFWARWFDLLGYAGLWWLGMWAAGQDIGAALANPWIMFFKFIPWFAVEALLLARLGTTPGKWLLNLGVTNLDGSRLDLAAATRRSARVIFTGVGFGWGLLAAFCQALSWITARRIGTTLWDHIGGHRVNAGPLHPFKLIVLIAGYIAAIQLQWLVISPYVVEAAGKSMPWLKKQYEQNPPLHLPKRG